MFDIELHLADQPGELAKMGEALGAAGISVEGGGMWVVGGTEPGSERIGVAHVLVEDGAGAATALAQAGLEVVASRAVLVQRLDQDKPGQLGAFCRSMSDADVNIELLYSDHANRLVVAVDDQVGGQAVSETWGLG